MCPVCLQAPSPDMLPRIDSYGAATAGSQVSIDMAGTAAPQHIVADKESQVQ